MGNAEIEVAEQEEDAEQQVPSLDLYHRAALIMQKGYSRLMQNLESVAESLHTSRRHLQRVWKALAEQSCRQQLQARGAVLTYVETLAAAEALEAVLFISHNKYDESPLRLQCRFSEDDQHNSLTKVFAVEHSWAVVLEHKANEDRKYLFLHGAFAPRILGTESATAETINKILERCDQMPQVGCFGEKWRLTETDEGPNNMRAEAMLSRSFLDNGWKTCHTICCAHRVHSVASKTWALQKLVLSGAIKTLLSLQAPGAFPRFLDSLLSITLDSLVIRYNTVLSPSAQAHRTRTLSLFCPDERRHRRGAKVVKEICATLLNGDWHYQAVWHICDGAGQCCQNQEHTRSRFREALPKLLRALQLRTLARNDWQNWQVSLQVIGLLGAVHSLFPRAFQHAFGQGGPVAMHPLAAVEGG